MMKKTKVGLIFGGNSSEYEVSVQSAKNIYEAIDKAKYEVYPMALTQSGFMVDLETSKQLFDNPHLEVENKAAVENVANIVQLGDYQDVDVFFPIVHGNIGEDGALQGLFRILNKPFVGSDVLSTAVTMDKDFTKIIAQSAGIKVADWVIVKRHTQDDWTYDKVSQKLGSTVFIKPSNQGSSVGISKAIDEESFNKGLAEAFEYDDKVLVEEAINGVEIEVAVLGNENPQASGVGQITTPEGEFYSYENKYIDESGATLAIPAPISEELTEEVRAEALKVYDILECSGLARVDFMLQNSDSQIVFNELNALPGFTNISMYPKLFELAGITYPDLIDHLISYAKERFDHKKELHHTR
ncbi:D-alanine--D-alanine ligase family protein [Holzapfeliella floricola]|nr:D-alanine--D-alanine ligase family protein [Holzapfeliella floricola]